MNSRVFENPDVQDRVVFLKTSNETNGEFTLLEVELAPGGGNSFHFHFTFSETFTPIVGILGIQFGKEYKLLRPSESFTVEPKVVHRFYNPGAKPIRFTNELRPASIGFENFIKIIYGLASEGLTTKKGIPKNILHSALISQMGDTHGTGVLKYALPFIKILAALSRKLGIETKLLERYCRD